MRSWKIWEILSISFSRHFIVTHRISHHPFDATSPSFCKPMQTLSTVLLLLPEPMQSISLPYTITHRALARTHTYAASAC